MFLCTFPGIYGIYRVGGDKLMQILSDNDLFNINGGSALVISVFYGLLKVVRWISKFIRF